jgi:hypothetical protein
MYTISYVFLISIVLLNLCIRVFPGTGLVKVEKPLNKK